MRSMFTMRLRVVKDVRVLLGMFGMIDSEGSEGEMEDLCKMNI